MPGGVVPVEARMSWNDTVIEQFRAGQDRIVDTFDRDALLLLHTTGAKSGGPRVSPVACFDRGDRLLIVASAAGRPNHPAWFHNLVAHPDVAVERWADGSLESFEAVAEPAEGTERDRLWGELIVRAPFFAEHQKKTDRVIPVVVLRRAGSDA
jgi:deazaflavin-dependent oxidoreductase (nitroreductase family)